MFRIPAEQSQQALAQLWKREMPRPVYTPRWLTCPTPGGPVRALAFTLPRNSPSFTGELSAEEYQRIFSQASGRFGSTLDYALNTYNSLRALGIEDRALRELLAHAMPILSA